MKLKRKITKAEFEQLTEVQQGLYIAKGEDYVLDIDDTAFDTLKGEKKALQDELDEYKSKEAERIAKAEERARKKAEEEYAKAKGDKDVEAIEKSWQEKYSKLEAEKKQADDKYSSYVQKSVIDRTVSEIANKISTSPTLISPHIRSRLGVDLTGAEPKVYVLDDNGQRSALTIAELEKSFIDNKEFSSIIKASVPNGGAKGTNQQVGSGAKDDKGLLQMPIEELAQHFGAKYGSQSDE